MGRVAGFDRAQLLPADAELGALSRCADGDPVSDQLYVTNFALFGLRDAVAATNDPELKASRIAKTK